MVHADVRLCQVYSAKHLLAYCEGFLLQNMVSPHTPYIHLLYHLHHHHHPPHIFYSSTICTTISPTTFTSFTSFTAFTKTICTSLYFWPLAITYLSSSSSTISIISFNLTTTTINLPLPLKYILWQHPLLLFSQVALLTYDDSVKRLIFGKKLQNHDVITGLLRSIIHSLFC